METEPNYPTRPTQGPLDQLWERPVNELVQLRARTLPPEEQERHTLYSLLVLALMAAFWNGNKNGPSGEYPWRKNQKNPNGHGYRGGDYLGHNIACIGVDGRGHVIDFDFNHNAAFDSTVEHAESRLVRRIFSLTHLHDGWLNPPPNAPAPRPGAATDLRNVTVYTSLEPCSQCAGMMTLGHVKDVVFLQRDPGQFSIGNILRNLGKLSGTKYLPPWPTPADQFGFAYFAEQEKGYADFITKVAAEPFYIAEDGYRDTGGSIASYLCTDEVYARVLDGDRQLKELKTLQHPAYLPMQNGAPIPGALANGEVLDHVRKFLTYAINHGRRGTPHQM